MSAREHSHSYEAWKRESADRRESDTLPAECDCGDTIRELLAEIAGTAAVFAVIVLIVRALS